MEKSGKSIGLVNGKYGIGRLGEKEEGWRILRGEHRREGPVGESQVQMGNEMGKLNELMGVGGMDGTKMLFVLKTTPKRKNSYR